jgi:hypothetical protein
MSQDIGNSSSGPNYWGPDKRFYAETPREMRLRIGQLTGNASSRLAGFKGVYEQLSGFAHPAAATALSGWHSPGEDLKVHWSSVPSFKNDSDFMMACVSLVELAQSNGYLWREVWEMYFGEAPTTWPQACATSSQTL